MRLFRRERRKDRSCQYLKKYQCSMTGYSSLFSRCCWAVQDLFELALILSLIALSSKSRPLRNASRSVPSPRCVRPLIVTGKSEPVPQPPTARAARHWAAQLIGALPLRWYSGSVRSSAPAGICPRTRGSPAGVGVAVDVPPIGVALRDSVVPFLYCTKRRPISRRPNSVFSHGQSRAPPLASCSSRLP